MKNIGAIILAAGKGKRLNMINQNKVVLRLADKPMIQHIMDFMKKIKIKTVVVVVGFAKETVTDALRNYEVIYAEQSEPLGTGHALVCGLAKLPDNIEDVLVVYGDDAVLYAEKHIATIKRLFEVQQAENAAITFLTIEQKNPNALGRILRDDKGKVNGIVEEKDATDTQRKITEINPGCFVFSVKFLKKYKSELKKSPVTNEFYINNFLDLAMKHGELVRTIQGGEMAWRGVNTREELSEAKRLISLS